MLKKHSPITVLISHIYIYINSRSSKFFLTLFLCFFLQFSGFSQSRVVIKDDAYVVLNTASTSESVFVVLANGNTNALTTSGTGGNIITKHENNQVKWNIGTNTGTYTLPFTTATTATNASESKIPASVNITGAGTGSGNIKFSSYTDNDGTDNYKVSDYKPSDVASVQKDGSDNSANVVDRWWIIDANGYTDKPDVTLSFTYDDDEESATGNTITEANIFPQRWNSTASDWDDVTLSGTLNTTTNTLSGVTVAKANFFRSWLLVDNANPLPVELLSFKPNCIDNKTVLKWATASEINNSHFEIQHSTDGETWNTIDSVEGAGNSAEEINYQYQVENQNTYQEFDYYRLKQVDFDGTYDYSKIEACNCNGGIEITELYPNPSHGEVNIIINSSEEGPLSLKIYDAVGKLVLDDVVNLHQGTNLINNFIQVENGKYFISANLSNGKYYDYGVIVIN